MNAFSSSWQAALTGALLAFTAALVYGLIFSLLTSLRAALRIRRITKQGSGTAMLYLANSNSVLIASLGFSLLIGLVAAFIQGLAWWLVVSLFAVFNVSPLVMALIVSILIVAGLHLILWNTQDIAHAILWRSLTSYGFWLGLPCLIFITITIGAFIRS